MHSLVGRVFWSVGQTVRRDLYTGRAHQKSTIGPAVPDEPEKTQTDRVSASEIGRGAAALVNVKPSLIAGILAGMQSQWATIAASMPRNVLPSQAIQEMMRSLTEQKAAMTTTTTIAESGYFSDMIRKMQSQQAGMMKALGPSSVMIDALKGVQMQQSMFADMLKTQRSLVSTAALASFSKSVQIQQSALARSVAAAAGCAANLQLGKLAAVSSASLYQAMGVGLRAATVTPTRLQGLAATGALSRPVRAYSQFSARTLERMEEHGPDSRLAPPLARSLEVAQRELMAVSIAASGTARLVSEDAPDARLSPIRRLNLLTVAQRDLVAYDRRNGSLYADEGFVVSLAEKAAETCRSVQHLFLVCYETAALRGTPTPFKLTASVGTALADLPWLIPTTKHQLSEFVTLMYFALYEGAGGNSLRYRDGDLLSDSECDFIWHLKHLRNKWLLHDIEHGSPSDVRAARRKLKESLEFFGLSHVPSSAKEYRILHRAILSEAERFLQLLVERLQQNPER